MIIIERKVKKYTNEEWVDIEFKNLRNGDVFKAFESTGEPILGIKGSTVFYANSDAYLNDDNIWCISIEEHQNV